MKVAASLIAALLLACGGTPATRTHYLLRAEAVEQAGSVDAPHRVGLGRVVVAPYLDQSGMVVEIDPGQVRAARQHEWAEPLEEGLRSYLRAEISTALGFEVGLGRIERLPWDYTIDVYIDRLHGTLGGRALIDAGYRITPQSASAEVVEYRFSRSVPLPREGYPGLFEAEVELSRELAHAIAAAVLGAARAPTAASPE
jgi:uncharacterized lipoprotein YmbA